MREWIEVAGVYARAYWKTGFVFLAIATPVNIVASLGHLWVSTGFGAMQVLTVWLLAMLLAFKAAQRVYYKEMPDDDE